MKTNTTARTLVKTHRIILCLVVAAAALAEFHLVCTWGKRHSEQVQSAQQPTLPVAYQGYDVLIAAR